MGEMACQIFVPARLNIWKAVIKAIDSATSVENWNIDSLASIEEAWTLFQQLYNQIYPRQSQRKKDIDIRVWTRIFDVY